MIKNHLNILKIYRQSIKCKDHHRTLYRVLHIWIVKNHLHMWMISHQPLECYINCTYYSKVDFKFTYVLIYIIINVLSGRSRMPLHGIGRAIARWNRLGSHMNTPWERFASLPASSHNKRFGLQDLHAGYTLRPWWVQKRQSELFPQ